MPNIRNSDHFENSWWDWSPYNECFKPTKIKISDLDGIVERRGHVLVIETKLPNATVDGGQSILFDQLVKIENWHVLIIWGETNHPIQYQLWGWCEKRPATQQIIKNILHRWREVNA
jgi:hypothetical protein